MKNKRDRLFFTQLFVPQASQSSYDRRAELDVLPRDSFGAKRLRNGDFYEKRHGSFCYAVFYRIGNFVSIR